MQSHQCSSCKPWWERFQRVAQHGDGCSYRTLERIECKVEYDPENNVPSRKCQRILQKFRECPGRPTEILETAVTRTDGDDEPLFGDGGSPGALGPNVGEAMEEFMRMAEEISRNLVEDGGIAVVPPAQPPEQEDSVEGLFARLFGKRRSNNGNSNQTQEDTKMWQQYESKFEEV